MHADPYEAIVVARQVYIVIARPESGAAKGPQIDGPRLLRRGAIPDMSV
jgi:hypothetical protein